MIGPMEAWLLARGMRTLPLRMREMSRNAMALAEFLSDHPQVEQVMYPGLPDHPGHALAAQQMHGGYGYMRESSIERFARDYRLWTIASGTSEIMREIIAKRLLD